MQLVILFYRVLSVYIFLSVVDICNFIESIFFINID